MKLLRNLTNLPPLPPLALTIGNFDGVHLGHLEIISQIKKAAKEKKLASAILTFQPHPILFLNPTKPRDFNIFSLAKKLEIFSQQQIDYVIVLPFNHKLSEVSAPDFIKKILLESLNIKHLTIGYDFTFGKNREGNFKMLEEFNLDLNEISPVKNSKYTCSSSIVRSLIKEGKIIEANEILGKNFCISGLVNSGKKLASQLGFPTANLIAKPHIIKPKFGVYKTETFIPSLNKKFSSITNFGIKPTVEGNNAPLFETHIPKFSQNIYGEKINVEFLEFLREEKKFSSLEELKAQIENDVKKIL